MPSAIGVAMRSREDPHLITGAGRFAGDITAAGQAPLRLFETLA